MKKIFCAILLFFPIFIFAQSEWKVDSSLISEKLWEYVNIIENENIICDFTGASGEECPAHIAFLELIKIGKISELEALTMHENAVVRSYAFWGLAKKNFKSLSEIILNHMHDTVKVNEIGGCLIGQTSVVTFMVDVVTPDMLDKCKKLKKEELKSLIAILEKNGIFIEDYRY